jgi:hypothetical protein
MIKIPQIANEKLYISNTNGVPELESDIEIATGIHITSNRIIKTTHNKYILRGLLNKFFIFIILIFFYKLTIHKLVGSNS